MKKCIAILSLTFISTIYSSESRAQLWKQGYGNDNYNSGLAIRTDATGNVYTTGYFQSIVNFGTTTLVGTSDYDIFLTKHSSSGVLQWAQKAGNSGNGSSNIGTGLYVDPAGNTYLTGYIQSTATVGGNTLNASGEDILLAKYDASGACQWAKNIGGTLHDGGYGICSDGNGNLYLTGFFQGTVAFGLTSLTSAGLEDIFIAKFDNAGTCQWAQRVGSSASDVGRAIAYANGSLYVTGNFGGTVTAGTTSLTSSGSSDIFIAKYDLSGNCVWATKAGGSTADRGYGIAADAAGNCYVSGYFTNNAQFGSTTYTSASQDQFDAKLDPSGSFVSVHNFASTEYGNGIIVDNTGHTYTTGSSYAPYFSGSSYNATRALCFDNSGNILSTGTYRYDGGTSNGIFVAKYANPTAVITLDNAAAFSLYPNPVTSDVRITGLKRGDFITITDVIGRIVQTHSANSTDLDLDISALSPGTYMVRIGLSVEKMVKL